MNASRSVFGVTLPAPAPHELLGLLHASAYLRRAGTAAATSLLVPAAMGPLDIALGDLRDSLNAAACLCDGMADLFATEGDAWTIGEPDGS
ncbi:MAG TPA: hypothetical protein VFX03_08635 [Thermomicrobiales bacterium]|nr:hypothetical protein [Thermomicrobiales bacterium]